ncbi:hypothetical protein GQ43DRAFT_459968 [Delitschia confertaspora ATCC 74209]|uniref:Uncharacterized protein n=1 Tax=Delitschia confertaspora ATCC 74209 TaxID=1513339 RepID=A0A9P4JTE9_9PLEO|nr:hypothetical protein GQ43DRAFT_459968 [Delitschia confertaspora ATCC 74209]
MRARQSSRTGLSTFVRKFIQVLFLGSMIYLAMVWYWSCTPSPHSYDFLLHPPLNRTSILPDASTHPRFFKGYNPSKRFSWTGNWNKSSLKPHHVLRPGEHKYHVPDVFGKPSKTIHARAAAVVVEIKPGETLVVDPLHPLPEFLIHEGQVLKTAWYGDKTHWLVWTEGVVISEEGEKPEESEEVDMESKYVESDPNAGKFDRVMDGSFNLYMRLQVLFSIVMILLVLWQILQWALFWFPPNGFKVEEWREMGG